MKTLTNTNTEALIAELTKFNCTWGDCGLEWNEEAAEGYLYPIEDREGNYMDRELGVESVIEILTTCNYRIDENGYIDLW